MKKIDIYPSGHFLIDEEDFPKFENKTFILSQMGTIVCTTKDYPRSISRILFPDMKRNQRYVHLDGNKRNFQKSNISFDSKQSIEERRAKINRWNKLNRLSKSCSINQFSSQGYRTPPRFLNGESHFD